GTDCRPLLLRRRAGRPQLKRGPLGCHKRLWTNVCDVPYALELAPVTGRLASVSLPAWCVVTISDPPNSRKSRLSSSRPAPGLLSGLPSSAGVYSSSNGLAPAGESPAA